MPIICKCKCKCNINQYKTKETRLINDQTLQHFSNALSSASWDDIVNDHDVHHSYRKFINVFSETFNSSFPVRPGSPPQKRKHKPWMTNGLVNACKKKNLLYKHFLTSRCSTSEIRYKTYKNKLTSILRYCEKQYYSDLLKANKNNMKETWKIINDLLNKKSSTRSSYPTEFMKNGGIISGNMNIAEQLLY